MSPDDSPTGRETARAPSARGLLARLKGDQTRVEAAFYAVLLYLVWGATAFHRGLWQDDASLLSVALIRRRTSWTALFGPLAGELRRLLVLPFAVAEVSPHPVIGLQLLYGACWLGEAIVAGWIARLLVPGRKFLPFLVTALALTATSDYLTNSVVALGYNMAVLALLIAVACGLRFASSGGMAWWFGSVLSLAFSLWTTEVAVPALPFVPVLFLLAERRRLGAAVGLMLGWAGVLIPFGILYWRFLHAPSSYAAVAIIPMSLGQWIRSGADLWSLNFLPWKWAFSRPVWGPSVDNVIPVGWWLLGGLLGVIPFGVLARRQPDDPPLGRLALALAACFAAMAAAANFAYTRVQLSDIHYRTHLSSRVWSAMGLGLVLAWCWTRSRPTRIVALVLAGAFLGFGVMGGLERQGFFLASWQRHQKELRSIVETAPAVSEGSGFILRSDATPDAYLATEADYLTAAWLRLLYDRADVHNLRMAPDRGTGCTPTPTGLECWHEGQETCVREGGCQADRFSYGDTLIFDFSPQDGRYHLLPAGHPDPLLTLDRGAYRPESRILPGELSLAQRRLLLVSK